MKTVLITGASGFIGRHLAAYLASLGYSVHAANLRHTGMTECEYVWDGADSDRFAAIVESAKPNFVIHLASRVNPSRDLRDLAVQYDHTVKPALSVVKALSKSLDLAIFFGSCEEYGDGPSPSREDQCLSCVSSYGWAKISAFHGVTMVATQQDVPWCWVRPYLVFGPGQRTGPLIPDVICGCLRGQNVAVSPGQQNRDLLYVDDLCRMIGRILQDPHHAIGQVLNLCTGRPRNVADIARMIQRLAGSGEINLGALPYRHRELMQLCGSAEKFESLFGEFRHTPLEIALANTVEAYRRALGPQLSA